MATQLPSELLGSRNIEPPKALTDAISQTIDRTYGPGYSFQVRSGITSAPRGTTSASSSGRHTLDSPGAADVRIFDPQGRQISGSALTPLAQNWVSNFGSIGINAKSSATSAYGWTHMDLVQNYRPGQGPVWSYGGFAPGQKEAIVPYVGKGTWLDGLPGKGAAGTKDAPVRTPFGVEEFQAARQTLKPGMGSKANPDPRVADLQQKLAFQGYYKGAIDGVYGRGTSAAVRDYQSTMRLDVDGVAGPQTLASLRATGPQPIDLTGIPVQNTKTPKADPNRLPDITRDIGFGAMPPMNTATFPGPDARTPPGEIPNVPGVTVPNIGPAPFSDRTMLAPAGPDVLNPYGSRAPAGSMPLPTVDPRKDIAGPFTPATPGPLPDFLNFFPSQASGVPLPNLDPRREAMGPAQADIPLPPSNPRRDASGAFPPAGIMPGSVLAGGPQGATATGVLNPMAPAQLAGSTMAGAGQGATAAGILSPSAAPTPLSGSVMAGGPQGAAATGVLDLLGPALSLPAANPAHAAEREYDPAIMMSATSNRAWADRETRNKAAFEADQAERARQQDIRFGRDISTANSPFAGGIDEMVPPGAPLPVAAGTPLAGYEPTPPTPQRTIDFDFATAPSPRGSMPAVPNFGWAGPNFDAAGARESIDRVLQDILGITGASPATATPLPYQNTTVGAPKVNDAGLPLGIYGPWSPGSDGGAAASPALAQRNAVSALSSQSGRAVGTSAPSSRSGYQTETSYRSNAAPSRSEMNIAGPAYTIDEVVSRSRGATDPTSIGFLERRDMGYDPLSSIRTPTAPGAPAGGIKDWFGATPVPTSPPPGVAIVKASPVPVAPPMPLAPVRPAGVAPPAVPVPTNKAKTGKVGVAERLLVNLGLIGPGSLLGRVGGGKGKSAADIIGSLIGGSYTVPAGSTVSRANFDPVSGGSRYDVQTSPSGVKSYTTAGGNTFITYDPSYGGLPGAPSADAGTLGSSSNTVLCTYYMQKGWLPRDLWQADSDFAKTLPKAVRRTYWRWAIPAVRRLRAGDKRLERLLWPIVKAWAHYAGWRMGIVPRRPVLGTIVHHICSTARFSRLMRAALG